MEGDGSTAGGREYSSGRESSCEVGSDISETFVSVRGGGDTSGTVVAEEEQPNDPLQTRESSSVEFIIDRSGETNENPGRSLPGGFAGGESAQENDAPSPEPGIIFECEEDQNVRCPSDAAPLLQTLSSQSLDDYIDVVTTYKCKFCLFSCCWKSGLKSHIRNCHLNSKGMGSSVSSVDRPNRSVQSKTASAKTDSLSSSGGQKQMRSQPNQGREQHIFLCGECSRGFGTFDHCRQHMFEDHRLSMPGKKRAASGLPSGRRKKREACKEEDESNDSDDSHEFQYRAELEADDDDDDRDVLFDRKDRGKAPKVAARAGVKRVVKAPKALQADFLLDNKKKRESKENSSEKPYKCCEAGCGCRFMTESNLEYHVQCHVGEDKALTCPDCGQRFDQWRRLLLHLWKEHLIDLDLLTCGECGYKTYSQFKLETHQKIHSDVRNYMCSTCGKSFKQLSQLHNHSVMHMDRTQVGSHGQKRWYNTQQCDVCGRNFSDSKCLRKHQQAVHSKIKPYICNFCGHKSARKAMLQLHMRQHTGERPFSCEHCDYKTGDHNSLRRHRMRHTGSKPYKCPHCPYSCIQAISLKTHLKNKHPGSEGLFACTMCGFRSVSKDNFVNHMSDHKRGIIPATALADKPATLEAKEAPQPTVPEGASREPLAGNMVSAQLICSCLNVLTQEGETVDLPPGCITVGENGTQTITIQIPTDADQETGEQYYFTIQQDLAQGSVTELGLLENGQLKLANEEDGSYGSNESVPAISVLQQGGTC